LSISKLNPSISVIITTYNRTDLLYQSVKSVINQRYSNYEIIIVDDHSTDGTEDLFNNKLNKLESRIRYFKHDSNKGLTESRNTGLKYANGDYVAFLDDDDEWEANKLEKQMVWLSNNSVKNNILYCGLKTVDNSGKEISVNKPNINGEIKKAIINPGLNTIPSSWILNTKELKGIGGFDTDLRTGIDHDFWMKLAKEDFVANYIPDTLVISRKSNNQMTRDVNQRIKGIKKYLAKWRPYLIEWFGSTNATRYINKYYIRVIGNLGIEMLILGDKKSGRKCFYAAFKYHKATFLFSKYCIAYTLGINVFILLTKMKRHIKSFY